MIQFMMATGFVERNISNWFLQIYPIDSHGIQIRGVNLKNDINLHKFILIFTQYNNIFLMVSCIAICDIMNATARRPPTTLSLNGQFVDFPVCPFLY